MPRDLNRIERKFLEQLTARGLLLSGERVLAAVSGGPDSMALLHLLCALRPVLGCSVGVAHCNFQLRGEESALDERHVKAEALRLGLDCHVRRFDTRGDARRWKRSVEEAARIERYAFFDELIHSGAFDKVATGHHVSDNAETVLFNLFRGASVAGLRGIRAHHGHVVRPLLLMSKRDIMDYLEMRDIRYRIDASNTGIEPDRNFIRNRVIPLIEERFGDKLLPSLQRLSANAAELEAFLELHFEELLRKEPGLVLRDNRLDAEALKRLSVFERKELLKRALQDLGCDHSSRVLGRLAELLHSQPGRRMKLSGGIDVIRKGRFLCFSGQANGEFNENRSSCPGGKNRSADPSGR